ncbi:MAG: sulfur carrier protein ThiS [Acidobacteria bacterium]|nr:sulfur carrier protein ThiS [Acidobacteriota bacterium]
MQILLNGDKKEFPQNLSLQSLVDSLALRQERIAVELNHSVIKRKDWPNVILKDGDQLEVVHFVGGG